MTAAAATTTTTTTTTSTTTTTTTTNNNNNINDVGVVYGCADVTWLSNAWVRRHGDQIVVTCNHSGEVYYVMCDDNHWPLELINCSRGHLINMHQLAVSFSNIFNTQ